jgi:hypothetical protein
MSSSRSNWSGGNAPAPADAPAERWRLRLYRWRRLAAGLLVLVGGAIVFRGVERGILGDAGWQGFLVSAVVGGLIMALGIARWRFLGLR